MKVGILTYHSVFNCGAILQSFALKKVLEDNGHEVCFINYIHNIKWNLRDFIGRPSKLVRIYKIFRYGYFNSFNDILTNFTRRYRSLESLRKNPPLCDVYIVGSDQVWNWNFYFNDDEAHIFHLDFGDNSIKRISYAASLGDSELPKDKVSLLSNMIKRLDIVSVREKSSADKIHKYIPKCKIVVNEDPTSMLTKEEYISSFRLRRVQNKRMLITYLLHGINDEQESFIDAFVKEEGLDHVNLITPEYGCLSFKNTKIVKPIAWLNYLFSSDYIISNSFHGIMFAILFNKKFLAFDYGQESNMRNERLHSLLELLGLSRRLVTVNNINEYGSIIEEDIDWGRVNDVLSQKRKYNIDSVIKSLYV